MGLLKRLLGGPACRNSSRSGRGNRHVESCAECRGQQQRERQYLERLHRAAIPVASDDLTARLLARTEQLAAEQAPDGAAAGQPYAQQVRQPRERTPALLAGGAAAMALMAGAAYLMGGEAAPLADGADPAAFVRQDAASSLVSGKLGNAGEAAAGTGTGWTLTGKPDFTPAGVLTSEQLATLRSEGWTCPELRERGFHMMWARGGVVAGTNILELRLTDGQHFVTVLEQHGTVPAQHGSSREQQPAPPVNVLTGHSATADGFTSSGSGAAAGSSGAGNGTLWINAAAPFRAIYQGSGATFTYVSDLPAEQANDGVAALMQARSGAPAGPAAADGITERMERGLGRILELLAP